MVRKRNGAPEQPRQSEPASAEDDLSRIVERADGFHWIALDGRQEFGPFKTQADALSDMTASDEDAVAPLSALQEVEREIGIADWIDPETGEPAEGGCPPHLEQE